MRPRGVVAASALAVVTFAVAQIAEVPLPQRWRHWRYSRAVSAPGRALPSDAPGGADMVEGVPPAGAGGALVRAAIPKDLYGQAAEGLADLRLIDASGADVPMFVHAPTAGRRRQRRDVEIIESSVVPEPDSRTFAPSPSGSEARGVRQIVADLGEEAPSHSLVELDFEEPSYFARVEVAIADALTEWRVVREGAPVFRFASEGIQGNQSVRYDLTRARYLRLRLRADDTTLTLRDLTVAEEVVETPERQRLTEALAPDGETTEGRSRWVVDLEGDVPVSEVRFDVDEATFHRPVGVEVSEDGRRWRPVGRGQIYGYPAPGPGAEVATADVPGPRVLAVDFDETAARWWRVTVFDRDDPPLDGVRATLWGVPRWTVFRAAAGDDYRLLYGNPRAEPAAYDLRRLVDLAAVETAPRARLGPEAVNPAWVDPAPWSERNAWVLWLALAIAVLVVGGMALRALREAS